jgi:hypothetical protein
MDAKHHCGADARRQRRSYIERAERPAVGTAFLGSCSSRTRVYGKCCYAYHDPNLVSVLLTIGVAER